MNKIAWSSVVIAALTVAGCDAGAGVGGSSGALRPAPACEPISGAIFTTLNDGTRVNDNIYLDFEDVYLDGGPGPNAPQGAAGLPDGNYFFQVTDPSGKELLSTDGIECREFIVTNGIITGVPNLGCSHVTDLDADHGATTVQLFPYSMTPNNGNEYKVWVTPVDAYHANGDSFENSCSKTDNFKVLQVECCGCWCDYSPG